MELLSKKEGEREYTHKSDVWYKKNRFARSSWIRITNLFFRSFGITIYEIFTHCDYKDEPYEYATSEVETFLKEGKRLPNRNFPFQLYDFMCWCWDTNPNQRPSFQQLSEVLQKIL